MSKLTELLGKHQADDDGARGELFEVAYAELHRLARSRLRDGGRNTVLDTTCLVHEAYLRFVSAGELRARGPTGVLRLRLASDALRDRQQCTRSDRAEAGRRLVAADLINPTRGRRRRPG